MAFVEAEGGCLDLEPLGQLGVGNMVSHGKWKHGNMENIQGDVIVASPGAQLTLVSMAERPPLPPNRKAFVDPGKGGDCIGPVWQWDRVSSWFPVGHYVSMGIPDTTCPRDPPWTLSNIGCPDQPSRHLLPPASCPSGWVPSPALSLP